MNRRRYGERSICKRCDLEIEFHGNRLWLDRGNNSKCPNGLKHIPNSRDGELI